MEDPSGREFPLRKVRLSWPLVPGAVQYQVVLLKDAADKERNIAMVKEPIFTNGVEISLDGFGEAASRFYWKVCALSFDGKPIGHFSTPRPVTDAEANPLAPKATTEFGKMDYFPLYPTYSWIPVDGAAHYEVQVLQLRGGHESVVRRLYADDCILYEYGGYTLPGRYAWQVRALSPAGQPMGDWSPPSVFEVTAPTPVAALGDSITHGGGAMSVPPGYVLYNWETYSRVPVKNLGFSGDTTGAMLARFERDVLPFRPRILVIMGGVNDFRGGVPGWESVRNLVAIREKCEAHGIVPVFATATPINPEIIALRGLIELPPEDWAFHQLYINEWILRQRWHVDTAAAVTDKDGRLRADCTTDGLHPDHAGKQQIGEAIGSYLLREFPQVAGKK